MQNVQLLVYLMLFLAALVCISNDVVSGLSDLTYIQTCYIILCSNGLVGIIRSFSDDSTVSKTLEIIEHLRKIVALPLASAEIFVREGIITNEGAMVFLLTSLWALYLYLLNNDTLTGSAMDSIIFLNCAGLSLVGGLHQNFYALSAGICFALGYWIERNYKRIANLEPECSFILLSGVFSALCVLATKGSLYIDVG